MSTPTPVIAAHLGDQECTKIDSFRSQLKTYLFKLNYYIANIEKISCFTIFLCISIMLYYFIIFIMFFEICTFILCLNY